MSETTIEIIKHVIGVFLIAGFVFSKGDNPKGLKKVFFMALLAYLGVLIGLSN